MGMMGFLLGNKLAAAEQAGQAQQELMKRAHPLPQETSARIQGLSPQSLSELINYNANQTPAMDLSRIGVNKAQADYLGSESGLKRAQTTTEGFEPSVKVSTAAKNIADANKAGSETAQHVMADIVKEADAEKPSMADPQGGNLGAVSYNSLPPAAQQNLQPKANEQPKDYQARIESLYNALEKASPAEKIKGRAALRHIMRQNPDFFSADAQAKSQAPTTLESLFGSKQPTEEPNSD